MAYALLSDYVTRDAGYCNQRIDLAGRVEDRATLTKYPLLVDVETPTPACRALLYFDKHAPDAWSPALRAMVGDDLSFHLTPLGVMLELFPLAECRAFLPLLASARHKGRIVLDDDAGAVAFDETGAVTAATLHPGTEEQANVGLVALRLARVRSVPGDCAFVTSASAEAVTEHLEEDDLAGEGALPERVRLRPFTRRGQPRFRVPPASERIQQSEEEHRVRQGLVSATPAAPYCLESQHSTSPARTLLPRRVWPLWDALVQRRFGFDLLRERSAVMGDLFVLLEENSAQLSLQWTRREDGWHVTVLRYLNPFADEEPALALRDKDEDMQALRRVMSLARDMLSLTVTSVFTD
jgi:hypothetical protein